MFVKQPRLHRLDFVDVIDDVLLGSLEDDVVTQVPGGVVTSTGRVSRPVSELVEQVGGVGGRAPHKDVEVKAPDGTDTVPGEGLLKGHILLAIVLQKPQLLAHLVVCG